MGDSSSFTRQKLASAVTGGYLALRQMGGSKPNSTFAAVQHTTHRPTPRANKSYLNIASTEINIQTQINNLNFNMQQSFTLLNNLLRTAPSGVVEITNSSLISYYNSLTPPPSPSIPSGTVFYGLAGTNIPANVFSGLTGRYVLIPDTGITIGSSSVTISGSNLVIGGTSYPIGSQVSIGGTIVDFLIKGSPAIVMPIPIFNLDPINFDFVRDFGYSFYSFFKDNISTTILNSLKPLPITQLVQPNPLLPFQNISLENPIALKFTPKSGINTLNDIAYLKAINTQNNKYIIVGTRGNSNKKQLLLTSIDGLNWSQSNPNNVFGDGELYCISEVYQGSLFIAGNDGTDNVLYQSIDTGVTWSKVLDKCNNEKIKKFLFTGIFVEAITESFNLYRNEDSKQINSNWTKINTTSIPSSDIVILPGGSGYITSIEDYHSGNKIRVFNFPSTTTDTLLSSLGFNSSMIQITSKFYSVEGKIIATALFNDDNKQYFIRNLNADCSAWEKTQFFLPDQTSIDSIVGYIDGSSTLYVAVDVKKNKSYSTLTPMNGNWTETSLESSLTDPDPQRISISPITKIVQNIDTKKLSIVCLSSRYPDEPYYTFTSSNGTSWTKTNTTSLSLLASNNINSGQLTSELSNYFEMRFLVNAPCKFDWGQIVSRDNLTKNNTFNLSALSGTPGSSTVQNIGINDTPPYIFGFFPPKLYELKDDTDYYLVMKLTALQGLQKDLKMQSFYFYYAS